MEFVGFASLDAAIAWGVQFVDASQIPKQSSITPVYRVYGPGGLLTGGTGSLSARNTGSITGAINASPIVITSSSHGLQTGMRVTISGILGNTAANGTFNVTVVNANSFSLDGSTGNGAYVSGGTWTVSGLYVCSITPTESGGYAQGSFYDVLVTGVVDSNVQQQMFRFGVI